LLFIFRLEIYLRTFKFLFIYSFTYFIFDNMTGYYQDISLDLQETEPFLPLILPDTYNESLSLIKNIEQMYQYLH